MPGLTVLPFNLGDMVHTYLANRTPTRTPGFHVSTIIQNLVESVPSLAKSLDMDASTRELMWSLGLVWETAIMEHNGWPTPPEIVIENIVCNADELDPLTPRIGEIKCTWKSYRNYNILDDFRYMTQAKAYCYAWKVWKCRFWILHLNGNYRPPFPLGFTYDLEFNQQELSDNWLMLQNHMRFMIAKGITY